MYILILILGDSQFVEVIQKYKERRKSANVHHFTWYIVFQGVLWLEIKALKFYDRSEIYGYYYS